MSLRGIGLGWQIQQCKSYANEALIITRWSNIYIKALGNHKDMLRHLIFRNAARFRFQRQLKEQGSDAKGLQEALMADIRKTAAETARREATEEMILRNEEKDRETKEKIDEILLALRQKDDIIAQMTKKHQCELDSLRTEVQFEAETNRQYTVRRQQPQPQPQQQLSIEPKSMSITVF